MNVLINIENTQGLKFPKIYKEFYQQCEQKIPFNMIGSDLFNDYKELKESAIEIVAENYEDCFFAIFHQKQM